MKPSRLFIVIFASGVLFSLVGGNVALAILSFGALMICVVVAIAASMFRSPNGPRK